MSEDRIKELETSITVHKTEIRTLKRQLTLSRDENHDLRNELRKLRRDQVRPALTIRTTGAPG